MYFIPLSINISIEMKHRRLIVISTILIWQRHPPWDVWNCSNGLHIYTSDCETKLEAHVSHRSPQLYWLYCCDFWNIVLPTPIKHFDTELWPRLNSKVLRQFIDTSSTNNRISTSLSCLCGWYHSWGDEANNLKGTLVSESMNTWNFRICRCFIFFSHW